MRAQGAFRVHPADIVSTEDGTGIVHIAPGFGEDDNRLGQAAGLPAVCPVDEEGRFTNEVPDYAGREVKEADSDIIRRLKEEGKLVHRSTIVHSYPHCWRCDTPLIYRAISTWFVRVEQLREHDLLGFTQPSSLNEWPLHDADGGPFVIAPAIASSSGETLRQMAVAGLGIYGLAQWQQRTPEAEPAR